MQFCYDFKEVCEYLNIYISDRYDGKEYPWAVGRNGAFIDTRDGYGYRDPNAAIEGFLFHHGDKAIAITCEALVKTNRTLHFALKTLLWRDKLGTGESKLCRELFEKLFEEVHLKTTVTPMQFLLWVLFDATI